MFNVEEKAVECFGSNFHFFETFSSNVLFNDVNPFLCMTSYGVYERLIYRYYFGYLGELDIWCGGMF